MSLPVFLVELDAIAAEHPGIVPLTQRLRQLPREFDARAQLVAQAAAAAQLGAFHTLTLLLMVEQDLNASAAKARQPWRDATKLRTPMAAIVEGWSEIEFELLVIEQHALACVTLGMPERVSLAECHTRERALLSDADQGRRATFLAGKREWLLGELQLDDLLDVKQHLVDELTRTRVEYVQIVGVALSDLVEAAHRLALMRYRVACPTLNNEELQVRLKEDLDCPDPSILLQGLGPELLAALRDSSREVQDDFATVARLGELRTAGLMRPASEEDIRAATRLYRELAQLVHPYLQGDHPKLSSPNQIRLRNIFDAATPIHRARVRLSFDRLVNYLDNLRAWKLEAERILSHMDFHAPSLLLAGDTFDERFADLKRASERVWRNLDAVRDDIAALEFDPQHAEYRRVIAMSERERQVHRMLMVDRAKAWNAEALRLAAEHKGFTGGPA